MNTTENPLTLLLKGLAFVALSVTLSAPLALLQAWPIMLALGVAHNDISQHVPALGYWACVLLSWGIPSVLFVLRTPKMKTAA